MKIATRLLFPLVLLICSCTKSELSSKDLIYSAVSQIPVYHEGWMIASSGGSASDGGCVMSRLTLKGSDRIKALTELKGIIKESLTKAHFTVEDGSSGGGGEASYFSFRINSQNIVGTLTVSSDQTSPSDILITMAIAQIQKR